MDYNKLYESLKYIQDWCQHVQRTESCNKCPMGYDKKCYVTDSSPCNWNLKEPRIKIMG